MTKISCVDYKELYNLLDQTNEFRKDYNNFKPFYLKKNNVSDNCYTHNKIVSHAFGQTFSFSPINDLCSDDFSKKNAINCLEKYPDEWWCIYDNCISYSRPIESFIILQLPKIN